MATAALTARWFVGVVLLASAVAKLGRTDILISAISKYELLPTGWVRVVAKALPITELALAIALLTGSAVTLTAIACGCLFFTFGVAMALNLARGRTFDCGCGLSPSSELRWMQVLRNLALTGMSLLVAYEPAVLAVDGSSNRSSGNALLPVPFCVVLYCVTYKLFPLLRFTLLSMVKKHRKRNVSRSPLAVDG